VIRDSLRKSDLKLSPNIKLGIVALNSVKEVLVASDLVESETTEDINMLGTTFACCGVDPRCDEVLMSMFTVATNDPLPGWNVEFLK